MHQNAELDEREDRPIDRLTSPFVRFARMEAASGLLLVGSTVAALIIANSRWYDAYHALWNVGLSIQLGRFTLAASFHEWLDDGLMSIFFFLVGLEIKREILIGELSSFRQAAFPFSAALGGTVIPAFFFFLVARGTAAQPGWGIPMATDIAFALGVLALLGSRVPVSLKIFVTALAIVDDVIAVLVIAIFYTSNINVLSLVLGLVGVGLALVANMLGVRRPSVYALIGIAIWIAVLKSGVHATVAGVLLAFTIPARNYIEPEQFVKNGQRLLRVFHHAPPMSFESHAALHTLEAHISRVESPLHRIEHAIQPWVSLVVMPLFAFANAGVHLDNQFLAVLSQPVCIGIILGLVLGKPLGIWSAAWLSVRFNLAQPPEGISWASIFGAAALCGIGFTMSLFIGTLAFGPGQLLDNAKIGILIASILAGVLGSVLLVRGRRELKSSEEFTASEQKMNNIPVG